MKLRHPNWRVLLAGLAVAGASATTASVVAGQGAGASLSAANRVFEITSHASTTTPIKHVVVIYQENVSFDHYFATYPKAANTDGEPFYAAPKSPSVNGLTPALLTANPNGVNPQRQPYTISGILTCDQNHGYTAEQYAFDGGKMDRFAVAGGTATTTGNNPEGQPCTTAATMNYYDGNVATAMWNYAQHFAMSDNSYSSDYGPSAPGAINLISGQTGGVITADAVRNSLTDGDTVADGNGGYTLISDAQPYFDDCSSRDAVALSGKNVGDQLNAAGLSWGFFQGGFTANTGYAGPADGVSTYNQLNEPGRATCTTVHDVGQAIGGNGTNWGTKADYIQHHEPFQYYATTANPHHLEPTSVQVVGADSAPAGTFSTANHNYDVNWFNRLMTGISNGSVPASHFPAVSILKAPGIQDGHAAYSDPIDEQVWLATEINAIEQLPTWSSTAIFIAYDDSDGFYDHAYPGVENPSATTADVLTGTGACTTGAASQLDTAQGRCGYGPRQPLMVISPYAKPNYVSHTMSDQSSILKFIEQNWNLGPITGSYANIAGSLNDMFNFKTKTLDPPLILNLYTGEPATPVVGTISPSSGPAAGGTKVQIAGINLNKRNVTVLFGNTPATSVHCTKSSTLLAPAANCTATAPAGHGKVAVTVLVGRTTSVDDASAFSYKG